MNNENPELKPTENTNAAPQMISSDAILSQSTTPTEEILTTDATEVLVPESMSVETTTPPVTTAPTTEPQTRYNPVTGEEMNLKELKGEKPAEEDAVNNEEKLKKVEVEYTPTSTGNTVMLIIFFIFIIVFVMFLPDIQVLIAEYKAGPVVVEEITTGKLVCELSSSTTNLDREITRTFEFENNKLLSAKFTTIIRGDATLDEEALDELNQQCEQIKDNVSGMNGISVSCAYENGKITEKETFDYSAYSAEEVAAAYAEAGGSVLEFAYEQDIDSVMTNMRQGGFTCNKEK